MKIVNVSYNSTSVEVSASAGRPHAARGS